MGVPSHPWRRCSPRRWPLGILAVRLSSVVRGGGGKAALLGMVLLWGVGAAALLWRAASAKPWSHAERLAALAPRLWMLAGVLVLGSLLTVTRLASLDPVPLALGALVVAALVYGAPLSRWWRPSARAGAAIDVLVVVVLVLVVVDLVVITPEDPTATAARALRDRGDPVPSRLPARSREPGARGPPDAGGHGVPVRRRVDLLPGRVVRARADRLRKPRTAGRPAHRAVIRRGLRPAALWRCLAAPSRVGAGGGDGRARPRTRVPGGRPASGGAAALRPSAAPGPGDGGRRAMAKACDCHGGAGLRHVGRVGRVGARGAGAHRCHVRRDRRLSGLAAACRRSRALAPQAGGDRARGLRLRAPAVRRRDARLHR